MEKEINFKPQRNILLRTISNIHPTKANDHNCITLNQTQLKSGRGWIISDMKENSITEGTNSDFNITKIIHPRRAEIFGVLLVLTFLKQYCKYFLIQFTPQSHPFTLVHTATSVTITTLNNSHPTQQWMDLPTIPLLSRVSPYPLHITQTMSQTTRQSCFYVSWRVSSFLPTHQP